MGKKPNRTRKRHFWQTGARTWKTVAAVFISMLADSMRPGGMPFYAAITAILCVQKSVHDSFEVAVNREIATVLGGLVGMAFLFAERPIERIEPPLIRYALLALVLVPTISLAVWLDRPKSAFLMCVVFLSVAIVHEEDVEPFDYAMNRVLDTTLGIAAALAMNVLPGRLSRMWRMRRLRRQLDADGGRQTAKTETDTSTAIQKEDSSQLDDGTDSS